MSYHLRFREASLLVGPTRSSADMRAAIREYNAARAAAETLGGALADDYFERERQTWLLWEFEAWKNDPANFEHLEAV